MWKEEKSPPRWAMWPGALFALLTLGCVAVPIAGPSESPIQGNKVDLQQMGLIAGQSRESVVAALGMPTVELTDLRILVYPWIESMGEWLLLSPDLRAGTTFSQTNWAVLVALDENGVVVRAGLVRRSPFDSINTTGYM